MSIKKTTTEKTQSQPSRCSASYESRPRRKPDSSTKGKLNRWEGTDYVEFVPAGTKESNRQILKQLGDNSFYKNEGKKESSYSLHLNVDGKSQDPVAEMFDIFMHLTEDQRKQLPQISETLQGRMLYDDAEHLKVWFDSEKGEVTIQARLECTNQMDRLLLQLQGQMNVTLARHRSELLKNNSDNNK